MSRKNAQGKGNLVLCSTRDFPIKCSEKVMKVCVPIFQSVETGRKNSTVTAKLQTLPSLPMRCLEMLYKLNK